MESSLFNALLDQGPVGIVCMILLVLYIRKDRECRDLGKKLDCVYEETIEALTRAKEESDKRAENWAKEFTDTLKSFSS